MKKILLLLVFMFTIMTSFAQNAEHLTFKGVPIDGTLSDFVAKMKSVGFLCLGEEEGVAVLKGDFAGYRECKIFVVTLRPAKVVNTIMVHFPYCHSWEELENIYESLKAMLTENYVEPAEVIEKFTGNTIPSDSRDKLRELLMDRCVWVTEYKTKKGVIQLLMDKPDGKGYFVRLQYYDKINTNKVRATAIDDL